MATANQRGIPATLRRCEESCYTALRCSPPKTPEGNSGLLIWPCCDAPPVPQRRSRRLWTGPSLRSWRAPGASTHGVGICTSGTAGPAAGMTDGLGSPGLREPWGA
eukprot:9329210-Pyramimonas_sp.AAC.1